MSAGRSALTDINGNRIRLVRGCPCYKEFGNEKVCVNNDDVLPIHSISIDPSFFSQINTMEDLANFKSEKESMCYLLISLNFDNGCVYCLSQGKKLRINEHYVKTEDIDAALQFVTNTEQTTDGVICSDCLYKYLISMSSVFEDKITQNERTDIITSYVKKIAARMAMDLDGETDIIITNDERGYRSCLETHISDLMKTRAEWASFIHKAKEDAVSEDIVSILKSYKQLSRLEAVFLFQVLSLEESETQLVALGLLKFMIELAGRVIRLNYEIREAYHRLVDTGKITREMKDLHFKHNERRKRTEHRFNNLLKVLSSIRT